ncbi:MAG: hypothetical protein HZB56_13670 [Deltaproteobacteria bacterium]|nr:hypothetical protein [Deltaproteobacteria bacterium]
MTRTLVAALALALGTSAAAQTPAPAAAPAAAPQTRYANLKVMGCEEFLRLAEPERAAVVWYISGDFKEAGRTAARFDLNLAGTAVPEVVQGCTQKPQANLLYTVVSWFKAHSPKPEKKGKKAAAKK